MGALVWALVVVYLFERVRPLLSRLLAVIETPPQKPVPVVPEPLPAIAESIAQRWEAPWAQEAARSALRERHAAHGSWDFLGKTEE